MYLIRHCQSTGNVAHGTSYDPLLTNQGLQQAIKLNLRYCKRLKIDKLISSPLRRCIQTAHVAFNGMDCPFELDPIWREICWRKDSTIDCIGSPSVATFAEVALSCQHPRLDIQSIKENIDTGVEYLWEPCKEMQPGYMNEEYKQHLSAKISTEAFTSLFKRTERTFAVVTHYGTIESLISRRASNGSMFCIHLKLRDEVNIDAGCEILRIEEICNSTQKG